MYRARFVRILGDGLLMGLHRLHISEVLIRGCLSVATMTKRLRLTDCQSNPWTLLGAAM
jgi:hypothetical protein